MSYTEFTEIAVPDDKGQLNKDEIAKLVGDVFTEKVKTLSEKFEKDISGLKSGYDSRVDRLEKALTAGSGAGTDLHKEVEKVKAEQDTNARQAAIAAALAERDDLWSARLEAKALGLPDDIVGLYDTPKQIRATVALAKHLGGSPKPTPKPAGNAGAGPRVGGEGSKPDPLTALAEKLKPLSELRGGS